MSDIPQEVPLLEKLRSVPVVCRTWFAIQWAEDGTETGHQHAPVGYMMHEAAEVIQSLVERNDRLEKALQESLKEYKKVTYKDFFQAPPWFKKAERLIDSEALPDKENK